MAIVKPPKKGFIWQTAGDRIQDTTLYEIDWLNVIANPVITVTSWRGILDMENFPGNLVGPSASFGSNLKFSLQGPMVATKREHFYVQITPYYSRNTALGAVDNTVPYVLPVGVLPTPTGVSEFEIYNAGPAGADNWTGEFYIYYELGLNYKGK